MSPEAEIQAALDAFEQNTRPIFVFYGDVPYFLKLICEFRAKYQFHSEYDYLTVDLEIAQRDTVAKTLFEIFRQIVRGLRMIEKARIPDETSPLNDILKRFPNVLEKIKNYESDEAREVELNNFREYFLIPKLEGTVSENCLVIEFNRFESVTDVGAKIRDVVVDKFLSVYRPNSANCAFFARTPFQPKLYGGSNADAPLPDIEFYQLQKTETNTTFQEDEWDFLPGNPWQGEIEKQIKEGNAATVFFGPIQKTDQSETDKISPNEDDSAFSTHGIKEKPTVRKNEKGLNAASELTGENSVPQEDATETLKRERENDDYDYDVFLCHNNKDKDAVKKIGKRLIERGILPWLDEWALRPGIRWQNEIEKQIDEGKAAAVFFGPNGEGAWQTLEHQAFIREYTERKCPVIPVFLEDYSGKTSELPIFLKGMQYVDFREGIPDPFEQLLWGITGKKQVNSSGESEEFS